MKGITIIEEHLCRHTDIPSLIMIYVFITLLATIGIGLSLYLFMKSKTKGLKILSLGFAICIAILCTICLIFGHIDYNTIHYEYTIKIDDSVYFNDFFDKYEIISIDGDTYRVKEIDK